MESNRAQLIGTPLIAVVAMGKTPKKAAPGGDERNLYVRRFKATTAPSRASESSLPERQRESEISNRFVETISELQVPPEFLSRGIGTLISRESCPTGSPLGPTLEWSCGFCVAKVFAGRHFHATLGTC